MRILFSVVGLLVVVVIVGKLAASQMQALKPAGSTQPPAQQAAEKIQKAIEQGAALRAAEAASQ